MVKFVIVAARLVLVQLATKHNQQIQADAIINQQ